jgi:flagella basal body P-ring formation protein FlgA
LFVQTQASTAIGRTKSLRSVPLIHAGDRLVVSEETAVSEGRFEATALTTAAVGEMLTVRLKFGGILHARATASGHASLVLAESEARQ